MNWRFAVLGGAVVGLAASPLREVLPAPATATAAAIGAAVLFARWRALVLLCILGALGGLLLGHARLDAIDAGAFAGQPGRAVTLRGFVSDVPRRSDGIVRIFLETADGKLLVEALEPVPELAVGAEVEAAGSVRVPEPWLAGLLRVRGVSRVVRADSIRLTGAKRGGIAGLLDGIRSRAEAALERGAPAPQAALARGFVLGQDDRIASQTRDEFRRSGLSHLLAVSGQNVVLLAALAVPVLALLGASLRSRLVWLLILIAIYVPVAGAGPSIQRASVMGAAGVAAVLASRPRSRAYALFLAALVTLALNPRAIEDVGWQLSFAAVVGIALWARPLAAAAHRILRRHSKQPRLDLRAMLAEGFGITAAATLATLPLIALHFDVVQPAALPANLLALPAVAPLMWLGMLVAFAGQLPALPVGPLNGVESLLVAYIEQVAHWCASPGAAQIAVAPPSWPAVAVTYVLIAAGVAIASRLARRRGAMRARTPIGRLRQRSGKAVTAALVVALVALAVALWPMPGAAGGGERRLSITFLDVGQGDAILLDPPGSATLLVDGGPPDAGLAAALGKLGAESLDAAVVTHAQHDHYGGLVELMGERPVAALLHADPAGPAGSAARAAGVPSERIAAGDVLRFGALRLEVLWPPAGRPVAGSDPNLRSLVILARWRGFTLLLTGDAEAETAPVDPGDVDVVKIAHHGSEDAGLRSLLDRCTPELAVISVGAGNSYGHPATETLDALAAAGVPVMRTDVDGAIQLEVGPKRWIADPLG